MTLIFLLCCSIGLYFGAHIGANDKVNFEEEAFEGAASEEAVSFEETVSFEEAFEAAAFEEAVSFEEAAVLLMGAQDVAQIPEDELERLRSFFDKPLKINLSGRSTLMASALFSAYQVASILDYRSRTGAILSPTELAVIDGFNPTSAKILAPFLDFSASSSSLKKGIPGATEVSGGYLLKIAEGKPTGRYYGKGAVSIGGISASVAVRRTHALTSRSGSSTTTSGTTSATTSGTTASTSLSSKSATSATTSSSSATLSSAEVPQLGWSLAYTSPSEACKIIVGRYHARFAQGLAQWSGLQMENFSSPQALMLHPGGISPYTSYSVDNAMYGAAGAFCFGRFVLSTFAGLQNSSRASTYQSLTIAGLSPAGANLSYNHRHGNISLTSVYARPSSSASSGSSSAASSGFSAASSGPEIRTSIDLQQMIGPVVLWGEICTELKAKEISATFGTRFPILGCDAALRCLYSPDTHAVAMAISRLGPGRKTTLSLSSQMTYNTLRAKSSPGSAKLKVNSTLISTPWKGWKFSSRFSTRLPSPRYEFRQDITKEIPTGLAASSSRKSSGSTVGSHSGNYSGSWVITMRGHVVRGTAWSWMSYAEIGRKMEAVHPHEGKMGWISSMGVYCQGGIFIVDKWDDRIYVYRRDAPGSMSIPALYGRGWYVACYTSLKIKRFLKLYLRLDYTAYPFARSGDTHTRPSLNARIQLVYCMNN